MGDHIVPKQFSGKYLEDPEPHKQMFQLWLATKKLPQLPAPLQGQPNEVERRAHVAACQPHHNACISYFSSTLKDAATTWFNTLAIPETIATIDALLAAFLLAFTYDAPNSWRQMGKYTQTKQQTGQTTEDFMRQVQDDGKRLRATNEQIRSTILTGLLPHLQSAVMQHDLGEGLADIKKWALIAENYQVPAASTNCQMQTMAQQLKELKTKLEKTQLRELEFAAMDQPEQNYKLNPQTSQYTARQQSPSPDRQKTVQWERPSRNTSTNSTTQNRRSASVGSTPNNQASTNRQWYSGQQQPNNRQSSPYRGQYENQLQQQNQPNYQQNSVANYPQNNSQYWYDNNTGMLQQQLQYSNQKG